MPVDRPGHQRVAARAGGRGSPARAARTRAARAQVDAGLDPHLVQHRDEILAGDVAGRARRHRAAAELAEARLEAVARPPRAPPARSPVPARACCGSARSAPPRPPATRAPREELAHLERVGHPGRVAEADLLRAGVAQALPRSRARARGGTWPSYGQPNDVEITPSQRSPSARARPSTASRPASDSAIERLTFLRLCVSDADMNTLISSNAVAARCARAARARRPARARWGSAPTRSPRAGTSIRGEHLRRVGQLRDHVGAHEARHLQAPQAGRVRARRSARPCARSGSPRARSEAVARAHLPDAHRPRQLAHGAVRLARSSSSQPILGRRGTVQPRPRRSHRRLRGARLRPRAAPRARPACRSRSARATPGAPPKRPSARRELVPDGSFSGHDNAGAVARWAPRGSSILSVPFRNQAETLANLKGALLPGQLLIDATVPLAAAVGGKATRMLGVWQGSAAQQTLEMVPGGRARGLRAHTVSAASLSELEHPLAQDVLVCGDSRADKRRGGRADRAHRGLRCVDCGKLEMARTTEALTALLISVNARYKVHAGIRLTSLPERCGNDRARHRDPHRRHRRREARAGDRRRRRPERLAAIVNTGDDIEIYGAHVSPDPDLVSFWLADAIDERGWGLRGDTLRGDGRPARARRRGLVQPRRPRPGVVPRARADARRGPRADAPRSRA